MRGEAIQLNRVRLENVTKQTYTIRGRLPDDVFPLGGGRLIASDFSVLCRAYCFSLYTILALFD